jgi:hypothetical protein
VSHENVELVRRPYAALPGLRDADPADDRAFLDRMFREFLDTDHVFSLPPTIPRVRECFAGAKA